MSPCSNPRHCTPRHCPAPPPRTASPGHLFLELVRLLRAKRPRAFLFENVAGLVTMDGGARPPRQPGVRGEFVPGETFSAILGAFSECGYEVSWRVVNARHWLPQYRERVFIVGLRRDLRHAQDGQDGQDGQEGQEGQEGREGQGGQEEQEGRGGAGDEERQKMSGAVGGEDGGWGGQCGEMDWDLDIGDPQHTTVREILEPAWLAAGSTSEGVEERGGGRSTAARAGGDPCALTRVQFEALVARCTDESKPLSSRAIPLDGKAPTLIASYRKAGNFTSKFVMEEANGTRRDGGSSDRGGHVVGREGGEGGAAAAAAVAAAAEGMPSLRNGASQQPAVLYPRHLRPRECARVMGFPDSFIIPGIDSIPGDDGLTLGGGIGESCSWFYQQIGNAVCPPVVRSIGANIMRALGHDAFSGARPTPMHPLYTPSGGSNGGGSEGREGGAGGTGGARGGATEGGAESQGGAKRPRLDIE